MNFFTGFRSSKSATPAKLFQVSTRRDIGHSAVSFASSFAVENDWDSSAPAGSAALATMLFSESIVNVDILASPAACCGRDIHHSTREKHQVKSSAIIGGLASRASTPRSAGTLFKRERQNGNHPPSQTCVA